MGWGSSQARHRAGWRWLESSPPVIVGAIRVGGHARWAADMTMGRRGTTEGIRCFSPRLPGLRGEELASQITPHPIHAPRGVIHLEGREQARPHRNGNGPGSGCGTKGRGVGVEPHERLAWLGRVIGCGGRYWGLRQRQRIRPRCSRRMPSPIAFTCSVRALPGRPASPHGMDGTVRGARHRTGSPCLS